MSAACRVFRGIAFVAVALAMACAAQAQSTLASAADGTGPKKGESFIDVAVGKPHYATSCGIVAGLSCSNNATSYSVTAGNMFTQDVGVELSWLDFGKADRAGGSVSARGLNASAVGRLPLGVNFALEGKLGATYGMTRIRAPAYSGIPTGRSRGVGLGYGVAMDIDMARGLQGAVGWEQHDFHFAGQGLSEVKNVTVSLGYRF